jgi:inner membrane protein
MDNLTHSLFGWALGQAGLKRKSRKGLAALILGANMPDLDVFFGHSCWVPLATHRGFTHSFVGGLIVLPPLLAGLLWLLDRRQEKRGAQFKSGLSMHFGWLVALAYIGTATHPVLDWLTSYAVQLFSPFSNRWYHGEALFIIDVWIWTGLALAIGLSRGREKTGRDGRRPAQVALAAALAYIGVNYGMTAYAKAQLLRQPPYPRVDSVFAEFEPARFWVRNLVWRSGHEIAYSRWTPVAGLRHLEAPMPDNMDVPLVRQVMFANAELRQFMRWSVMPMAAIEQGRCRTKVTFTDARFRKIRVPWREGESPFRHEVIVATGGAGCR